MKLNATDVQILDTLYDRHPHTVKAAELAAWIGRDQTLIHQRLRWLVHYNLVQAAKPHRWELTQRGLELRDRAPQSASCAPTFSDRTQTIAERRLALPQAA